MDVAKPVLVLFAVCLLLCAAQGTQKKKEVNQFIALSIIDHMYAQNYIGDVEI